MIIWKKITENFEWVISRQKKSLQMLKENGSGILIESYLDLRYEITAGIKLM